MGFLDSIQGLFHPVKGFLEELDRELCNLQIDILLEGLPGLKIHRSRESQSLGGIREGTWGALLFPMEDVPLELSLLAMEPEEVCRDRGVRGG